MDKGTSADLERDFAEDVKINKYRLDEECERHASTYRYWANELAGAKADVDRADDRLKLILANTELAVRERAVKDGVKITEAGVKAEMEDSDDVKNARQEVRKANKAVYVLSAAVSSMEHRRSELDNLVKLFLAGYFSTPTGQERGVAQDTRKETMRNLNKKGD